MSVRSLRRNIATTNAYTLPVYMRQSIQNKMETNMINSMDHQDINTKPIAKIAETKITPGDELKKSCFDYYLSNDSADSWGNKEEEISTTAASPSVPMSVISMSPDMVDIVENLDAMTASECDYEYQDDVTDFMSTYSHNSDYVNNFVWTPARNDFEPQFAANLSKHYIDDQPQYTPTPDPLYHDQMQYSYPMNTADDQSYVSWELNEPQQVEVDQNMFMNQVQVEYEDEDVVEVTIDLADNTVTTIYENNTITMVYN